MLLTRVRIASGKETRETLTWSKEPRGAKRVHKPQQRVLKGRTRFKFELERLNLISTNDVWIYSLRSLEDMSSKYNIPEIHNIGKSLYRPLPFSDKDPSRVSDKAIKKRMIFNTT